MLIGIAHDTIAHRGLPAVELLALARERRLDGIQFGDAMALDPALDPSRLATFREQAEAASLYLEVGLPSPNPGHRARVEGRAVTPREHARDLVRHLEAVAVLECRHAHAHVELAPTHPGCEPDRAAELAATREVLNELRPALRGLGLRIALVNDADLSTLELIRLVDEVGPDIAGVTLDIGHLVLQLDDPVEAAGRLAPLVLGTQINDTVLSFSPRGLCWQARPVGSGVLPITEILSRLVEVNPGLNFSIALTPGIRELPIYDSTWLNRSYPALRADVLAAIVRLTAECERRYASGELERPEVVETVPWAGRDLEWLAHSAGYLRPISNLLGSL